MDAYAAEVEAHASGVRLTEDARLIMLDNGEISMAVLKEGKDSGAIQSLTYRGHELLGGGGSGYLQVALESQSKSRPQWRARVSRREPTLVEVEIKNVDPQCPFDLASYYIVRAGEPGFFNYLSIGYDAARHPGIHSLAQYNFCLRVDPHIFTVAAVDDERIHEFPKPSALTHEHMVMDATYRLADGNYYSKYFYAAEMNDQHRVHGVMGNQTGLWIIMPSHEHLNGGPEHQELTVHQTDSTPVLLRHATAAHFGAGVLRTDSKNGSWSKVSAPWFVYVNTDSSQSALWQDAQHRAKEEAEKWPYAWLDDRAFQLDRGRTSGRLLFGKDEPSANVWVILAEHEDEPSPLSWQQQWRGYRFHCRTAQDGSFSIPKVRPGIYDLYAWGGDRTGQFVRREVQIVAGKTTELGELLWSRAGGHELVWQLGKADRSAAEFGFAEEFRQWGLWDKIAAAKPEGVHFVIGKHDLRDFPFEMAVTQNDDSSWKSPVWRVAFDYNPSSQGRCMLTLGIAAFESLISQQDPQIQVGINGTPVAAIRDLIQADAAHRSGIHSAYQERIVTFDTSLLHDGTNELTLELPTPSRTVSKRLGYPAAALQWDCLRLEIERRISEHSKDR
jgi:rhamnogalacturonan endolyase